LSSAADLREGALARIRDALAARGVDALWVESSVNLRYLTGLALLSLERPCGLLVPARGEPRMLVPRAAGS
jgi:Xaa-Pro aminopeptidase